MNVVLLDIKDFLFTVCSRALRNYQLCNKLNLTDDFGGSV
jgi:hypothetical protein